MKNNIITLALFIACTAPLYSQLPAWAWAKSPAGHDGGEPPHTAIDAQGNIFMTGEFTGATAVFGSYTLTNPDTAAGIGAFYIVKYDPYGNVLWAHSGGGNGSVFGNGIAADQSGNAYVTGWFFGDSAVFDGQVIRDKHLFVVLSAADFFLARYDVSGTLRWVKTQDTTSGGLVLLEGVTTDGAGNVYVAGDVEGSGGPVFYAGNNIVPSSIGFQDIFTAKLDSDGNMLVADHAGVASVSEYCFGTVADRSGNTYTTGYYQGTSIQFGSHTLTSSGGSSIYVVKQDPLGNTLWASGTNGGTSQTGYETAIDRAGNVYATGTFSRDSLVFGTHVLLHSLPAGNGDIFLVKFDTAGNALWAATAGGAGDEMGYGIAFDASDNVYLSGTFTSDTLQVGSMNLVNAGGQDIFLAEYSPAGSPVWAAAYGGIGNEYNASVSSDPSGNIILSGAFASPVFTIGSHAFSNADTPGYHIFIASTNAVSGITDLSVSENMRLYPNPNSGSFIMETHGRVGEEYAIYDMTGREIAKAPINSDIQQINEPLAPGIYQITVRADNGIQSVKRFDVLK